MTSRPQNFDRYALYGEENSHIAAEFIHIEPISTRSSRYEWTISPHTHPGIFQLIFLELGGGALRADDVEIDLVPASLVAIPSGAIHAFAFAENAEGWVLSVATPLVGQIHAGRATREDSFVNVRRASVAVELPQRPARQLSWLFGDIAGDFAERGAGNLPDTTLAILTLIFAVGSDVLAPGTERRSTASGTEARREQLVQSFRMLVEQHFRDGWSVSQYALELGSSTPTLTRACQAVINRPPGEVVFDRLQLEAMRALTYSATNIGRIAEDLGFADPAYFTRFFKTRVGLTPSRFRADGAWIKSL